MWTLSSQRSATLDIAGDGAVDHDRLGLQFATDICILAEGENSPFGNNLAFQLPIKV